MAFLQCLDCARALTVKIMLDHAEFDQISSLLFNPLDYNSEETARSALCATSLLSKYDSFPSSVDTKVVAIEKLLSCEEACKNTNDLFVRRNFSSQDASRLFRMKQKIAEVLGRLSIDRIVDESGWGPGVTILNKGRKATPFNKFRSKSEANLPLARLAERFMKHEYPTWDSGFVILPYNQITTVPKNNRTDRPIAIEPSLNLWFQKGVGSCIRSRLKLFGIDLKNQTTNQRLAKIGSATGDLATIDFSSASDTISWGLVLELLPFDWFHLLDILRSSHGKLPDGTLIEYEKFSSMGNGYTFELESLIFYAAALAVVHEDDHHLVSVYGDDLIAPSRYMDDLQSFFSTLGFTINTKKSYSTSCYRESCGKHYWNGQDITPIYFRTTLKSPLSIFTWHNRVIDFSMQKYNGVFLDKSYLKHTINLKKLLPERLRLAVPRDLGDSGFWTHFDRAVPPRNRRYQRGYNLRVYTFKGSYSSAEDHAVLLTRLWCRSIESSFLNDEPLPRVGKYRVHTIFSPIWSDLPQWS